MSDASLDQVQWRIAKMSGGGNCVQVAANGSKVLVSDSKLANSPILSYTKAEWAAFLDGAKNGEFDDFIRT
jgi:Domain of unknown function (DUF397)